MASDITASTTGNLMSGSIKWTGLASGSDFGKVVDQLVEIERTNINRLEKWRDEWTAKIESINGLNERLASLRDNSKELDSFSEFYARTSSSSQPGILTTTNTSTATPGSHKVTVAESIPGRAASISYDGTSGIGGNDADDFVINIGSSALTLAGGVDFTSASTIFDIASAINAMDDAGTDMLEASVRLDKNRDGADFYRLIINSKRGGSDALITVSDPTRLNFDTNSIDPVYEKTWLGTSHATAGGTYQGSTNKTFTFSPASTGDIGTGELKVRWADTEGHSGTITVTDADTDYEVYQGITVRFSAGKIIKDDSFTVDAYNPVLQAARDSGLAQAEQRVHQGFPDLLTPVTTTEGKLVYRYGGVEHEVIVPPDSKLQGLVDAINHDTGNPGVTATIINDGQNTSTSYHLVLTGKETGASKTIQINGASSTLTNFDAADASFSISQRASNAMLKVDGYPTESGTYLQRPTNTVSDIIDGVVMELHDTGTTTVTISNDLATVRKNIEMFVNSVNFVQDYIRTETKFDKDTGEKGVMIGNYTYDIVRNSINEILFNRMPGLDTETDAFVHLAQIGIKTNPDNDGKWEIDKTKLNDALNKDPEALARLFVSDPERNSKGIAAQLAEKLAALTDSQQGIGNVLINNYNGIIDGIDNKISNEERRVAMVKDRLEQKFANLETLLSQLNGQSAYLESQLDKLPTIGK